MESFVSKVEKFDDKAKERYDKFMNKLRAHAVYDRETKLFDLDTYVVSKELWKSVNKFNTKPVTLMVAKKQVQIEYTYWGEQYKLTFEEGDVVYMKSSLYCGSFNSYSIDIDGINGFPGEIELSFDVIEDSTKALRVDSEDYDTKVNRMILDFFFNDMYFERLDTPKDVLMKVENAVDYNTDFTKVHPMHMKYMKDHEKQMILIYTDDDEYESQGYSIGTSICISWINSSDK